MFSRNVGVALVFLVAAGVASAGKPFTGLVPHHDESADILGLPEISMEFFYIYPSMVCQKHTHTTVVSTECAWDFTAVETKLAEVAARGHQAVVRLADITQTWAEGWQLKLPDWVLDTHGGPIATTTREVWGNQVTYARWDAYNQISDTMNVHVNFTKAFITEVGRRLDSDRRVAYVQGFVGHWSEGHVYRSDLWSNHDDIGVIFPSSDQYRELLTAAAAAFPTTLWMTGISLGDSFYWYKAETATQEYGTMFAAAELPMGTYEDTFNDLNPSTLAWNDWLLGNLGADRWTKHPRGGEVSFSWYDNKSSQSEAAKDHVRFIESIHSRHMTFSLGSVEVIKGAVSAVSAAFGYDFAVTKALNGDGSVLLVTVHNNGAAPIYYDTYVRVGSHTVPNNLNTLMPGTSTTFLVDGGSLSSTITLVCDRSLTGTVPYN